MKQAVILAGGLGTRLRERLGDLPKPMIPIGGRPLLDHQLALCRRHGFDEVLILAGHRGSTIREYVGDGSRWGVGVRLCIEPEARGTAGAVVGVESALAPRYLVVYGDEMLGVDLDRLWRAHAEREAAATLLLHPNDHPLDSDLVEVDDADWIVGFHPRPHPAGALHANLVNAALYVIERGALAPWKGHGGILDFGRDVFPELKARGGRLYGYRSSEYIKDIGTPERYDRVCAEFEAGLVARSGWDRPQRAVFLDRDGTLNAEVGGVCRPEDLELLPGVAEAVRRLNHAGYRAVVITNQPVVAKGWCTAEELRRIHHRLEMALGAGHGFLDRIYVCPHHPERGFPGERPELKIECDCRKPGLGLVRRAVADLGIALGESWLVGDSTTDLATARAAGVRSVLVRTGLGGRDGKHAVSPDFVVDNVGAAVALILEQDRVVA
ncbi:MAG TPA: HAD-IIIA family hydrolase [Verrucomicrobiota bacterium]|nr:HAD-IIIA family hydrolase [Verrucomicrobiota bacterium]HNU52578.1 HAD-IIIA family hydrolase [Verrucomicrobiota bacterium]